VSQHGKSLWRAGGGGCGNHFYSVSGNLGWKKPNEIRQEEKRKEKKLVGCMCIEVVHCGDGKEDPFTLIIILHVIISSVVRCGLWLEIASCQPGCH
jgi:hypothetical protein